MVTPELLTRVRDELSRGVSKELVEQGLTSSGWNAEDIKEAVRQVSQPVVVVAPKNISDTISSDAKETRTKTILTVLLLIFITPVGLILMWVWMKWASWVKILVTLLLVLPALTIVPLTFILLTKMNPSKQFAMANNTKRQSDTLQILNAVYQYEADNMGKLPLSISSASEEISSTGADICKDLVPKYLAGLPVDPSLNKGSLIEDPCPSFYETKYFISKDGSSKITVSAPSAENGETISVSR